MKRVLLLTTILCINPSGKKPSCAENRKTYHFRQIQEDTLIGNKAGTRKVLGKLGILFAKVVHQIGEVAEYG